MFCSRCGTEVQVSSRFCPTCGLDLSQLTQGLTTPAPAVPAGQGAQPDEADIVRDALKDEYELEKELGRGGMAIVFKARDKSLEREVAIKVLPFSLSFDAEFVERFQREARTAGKLEHPNIIPIYRVGKSGRVIYFVMKFIRGKSLSAVIEARGALPVPEAKRLLIECCRGLGFAHKHGIVHRDIKPDNIMFDELGQAIVTDFGIAKAQSGARLTGTGMSIGTPHYMSPEQARAQNLDGRSDVYSLGVVAYQCLTGHVPFDGEDSFSIGYKHIMEELPTPPLETADQRDLFAIIQKMMAKKAEDRFQTAEEVVQALETLGGAAARVSVVDVATAPTRAIPVMQPPPMSMAATTPLPRASASMKKPPEGAAAAPPAPAAPPAAAPPARPRPVPKPAAKPKKSKAPFIALAAVVVVAIGLGSYFVFLRGGVLPFGAARADSTAAAGDSVARVDSQPPAPDTLAAAPGAPTDTTTTAARTPEPRDRRDVTPPPPTGPTGTLSLSGVPSNARIRVDNRTATTREKLSPGRHRLRIEAQGYETYEQQVDISANVTTPLTVRMQTAAAAPQPQPQPTGDCSNPSFGLLNANRACYDSRPSPRTPAAAQPPASCTGTVTPATLLLRVSATGDVETASVRTRSNCQAFTDVALATARDLAFTPATKGGQPVAAWIAMLISPLPR